MPIIKEPGFDSHIPSPSETLSDEKEQIENAKTDCQKECQTLSATVETHQKFLNYAKHFEAYFGKENLEIVAKVLANFQQAECPDDDLCAFPPEDVLELIQTEVESQIKDSKKIEKKSEQAQVEKNLDGDISELAQEGKTLDRAGAEKDKTIEDQNLSIAALKDEVFSDIGPQNISGLKQGVHQQHKQGEISQTILDQALDFIAQHEATLKSFKQFFKPDNPKEQAVFQNIVSNTKLDLSANSNAEIYSDVFAQIDAGIADEDRKKELKESIAKQLGVTIHKPEIKTGPDITQAIHRGFGTDENGNKVPYNQSQKLKVAEGLEAYPQNGELIMEAQVFGGRVLRFKTKVDDTNLTEKVNKALMIYLAEMKGLTGISHEQGFHKTQGGAVIDLSSDVMDDRATQFTKSVLRHYVGGLGDLVNQRLMTQSEMKKIDWAFQWFHKSQGDLTGSDGGAEQNDAQQAKNGMVELGLMDKSGNLNHEQLKTALLYIQGQKIGGEPNFEQLKSYLKGRDGEDRTINPIE